jgi:hypothetical protein
MLWEWLEWLSNHFYQPLVFWGLPLLLALFLELLQKTVGRDQGNL